MNAKQCINAEYMGISLISITVTSILLVMAALVPYLILCVILYLLISLPLRYLFNRNNDKLPPGKTGLPFVGETLTYIYMAKKDQVYKFISDRKLKYSPKIFRTSLLGHDMAVVCTAEGNKFLFSNEGTLFRTWWPPVGLKLFAPYEEAITSEVAKKDRSSIYVPFLKPQVQRTYVPTIDSVTKQNLELHWKNRQAVKPRALVLHHMFLLSCRLFLSMEDSDRVVRMKKLFEDIARGITSLPIELPGTNYWRARRAAYEFCEEIKVLMKEKKMDGEEEEDLLTYLMKYRDEDGIGFTEDQVAVKVLKFIFPAYHTSSTTIVPILDYLAEMPLVYDLVFKEQMEIANSKNPGEFLDWEDVQKMKYTWNVVREALRLKTASGGFKEVITDFHYEGFYIPRGWKLHWNVYATHKNPEYFPDPEKFDPSRFEGKGPIPFSYVPFGGGPRMCPGYEFARLQILVFMHNMVINFKWKKVSPNEKIVCDPVLAPTNGLLLHLYPHKL